MLYSEPFVFDRATTEGQHGRNQRFVCRVLAFELCSLCIGYTEAGQISGSLPLLNRQKTALNSQLIGEIGQTCRKNACWENIPTRPTEREACVFFTCKSLVAFA